MKKLFFSSAILLCILIAFQSCSKQSISETVAPMNSNTINATIAPNGSYVLPIDNPGSVGISLQASHFQVSETGPDSKSGVIVYKYIPAADYRGTDVVVLSNTTAIISSGSECHNSETANPGTPAYSTSYITVKLNITN